MKTQKKAYIVSKDSYPLRGATRNVWNVRLSVPWRYHGGQEWTDVQISGVGSEAVAADEPWETAVFPASRDFSTIYAEGADPIGGCDIYRDMNDPAQLLIDAGYELVHPGFGQIESIYPANSSLLVSLHYHPANLKLAVTWADGTEGGYTGVPRVAVEAIWQAALHGESVGQAFNAHVRNAGYPYHRFDGGTK